MTTGAEINIKEERIIKEEIEIMIENQEGMKDNQRL